MDQPLLARCRIPPDHPAFDGHFPGQPILPGVVLLAEVLEALRAAGVATGAVTLRQAKFVAPVGPGAELAIALHDEASGWRFEVREGDRLVASGQLSGAAPGRP